MNSSVLVVSVTKMNLSNRGKVVKHGVYFFCIQNSVLTGKIFEEQMVGKVVIRIVIRPKNISKLEGR